MRLSDFLKPLKIKLKRRLPQPATSLHEEKKKVAQLPTTSKATEDYKIVEKSRKKETQVQTESLKSSQKTVAKAMNAYEQNRAFAQEQYRKRKIEIDAKKKADEEVRNAQDDLDPKELHPYFERKRKRAKVEIDPNAPRTSDVYVGIDFGTSYTKAFFKSSEGISTPIEFCKECANDDAYFLPSRLFYNPKTRCLSVRGMTGTEEIVEYFKYGMIKDEMRNKVFGDLKQKDSGKVRINICEFYCSVFFLAYVISYSKNFVSGKLKASKDMIKFRFNMGCPIDNWNDKSLGVYEKALKLGYLLSKRECLDGISLEELQKFCEDHENDQEDCQLQTIPELYAEAYSFINDNRTKDGFYIIFDVGGGTVDFAVIWLKRKGGVRQVEFISQNVAPYGAEMLLRKFYPDCFDENEKTKKRNDIRKESAVFKPIPQGKRDLLKNMRGLLPYEFRDVFYKTIQDTKFKLDKTKILSDQKNFPVHMYGGGANYKWYLSIIKEHNPNITGLGIPPLECNHKKSNLYRLIIAENLALIHDYDPTNSQSVDFGSVFTTPPDKIINEIEIADYILSDT